MSATLRTTRALFAAGTAVLACVSACASGGSADDRGNVTDEPTAKLAQPEVKYGQCEDTLAFTGFHNDFIAPRREPFTIEFDAQPFHQWGTGGVGPIDGVIGLGNGIVDAFTDLGPIVRFNPAGAVDARNGSVYAASATFPYKTESSFYHFRMQVDPVQRRYSAWVNEHGFPAVQVANNFAFRTEQSALSRLDVISRITDGPGSGNMNLCGVHVSPQRCRASSAGTGWSSEAFARWAGRLTVEFEVTPLSMNPDVVIGVSLGAPTTFRHIAASLRLNPDGFFDARNGGTYQAAGVARYEIGQTYYVRLDIDRPAHRYYAVVRGPGYGGPVTVIAQNYAFRTEQSAVAALDHVGQFVDGASGDVNVCNVIWSYEP